MRRRNWKSMGQYQEMVEDVRQIRVALARLQARGLHRRAATAAARIDHWLLTLRSRLDSDLFQDHPVPFGSPEEKTMLRMFFANTAPGARGGCNE